MIYHFLKVKVEYGKELLRINTGIASFNTCSCFTFQLTFFEKFPAVDASTYVLWVLIQNFEFEKKIFTLNLWIRKAAKTRIDKLLGCNSREVSDGNEWILWHGEKGLTVNLWKN